LPQRDLESLNDILNIDDGFAKSSIELYNSIMERGWDYTVRVKTAVDIPIKPKSKKKVIAAGTVLELISLEGDMAVIAYDNHMVNCQAKDLIYTY
jgi:hypothetical protein